MSSTLDIIPDTAPVRWSRLALLLGGGLLLALVSPAATVACSPPFNPTIEALGPGQVVVLGTIGERVPGGRLFHVERWYNGGGPRLTPILIAFQEGEPVGDCSYIVSTGTRLIIAPDMDADGRLSANIATIQGDPATPEGRKWLDEATRLFGAGVVPESVAPPAAADPGIAFESVVALIAASAAVLSAGVWWWRRRSVASAERA
jgi:hypothetical protein